MGLRAAGFHRLAGATLARSVLTPRRALSNGRPTILIGGVGRVGKTTLATELGARLGYFPVSLDFLASHAYTMRVRDARTEFKDTFYRHLLTSAPTGVVIEGNDLVIEDRWYESGMIGREPMSISTLVRLGRSFGIPTFVVGRTGPSVEATFEGLRRDRGWISELTESELRDYAAFIHDGSSHLRALAEVAGVTYLEVDAMSFHSSIRRCADLIIQALDSPSDATDSEE